MAIYNFIKPQGQKILSPLVKVFVRFNPNFLTFLGLVFSLGAGFCYFKAGNAIMLLVAIPFILLRMAFNVLDGMVARQTQKTSKYGEALAEFLDRLSDVAIVLGIVFSGYTDLTLGLLGLVSMLVVSYLGILGKAMGAGRQFAGILGKVDRLILIILFSFGQYFLITRHIELPYALKGFDILMLWFITGGLITIWQRWQAICRQLTK